MLCLFVCLFQPLSSTETDRRARKYPLRWQWCELLEITDVSRTDHRENFNVTRPGHKKKLLLGCCWCFWGDSVVKNGNQIEHKRFLFIIIKLLFL